MSPLIEISASCFRVGPSSLEKDRQRPTGLILWRACRLSSSLLSWGTSRPSPSVHPRPSSRRTASSRLGAVALRLACAECDILQTPALCSALPYRRLAVAVTDEYGGAEGRLPIKSQKRQNGRAGGPCVLGVGRYMAKPRNATLV
jgi:hypothetical protein